MSPSPSPISSQDPQPDTLIRPSASLTYWSSTPATVSGMLGGLPQISTIDLRGSYAFVQKLIRLFPPPTHEYPTEPEKTEMATRSTSSIAAAQVNGDRKDGEGRGSLPFMSGLDCGAGIGRVTSGLLSRLCSTIDAVEPIVAFADKIRDAEMSGSGVVRDVYISGLESFVPIHQKGFQDEDARAPMYDFIWIQWCVGHITDEQLILFLKDCRRWLRKGGWVVMKENMSTTIKESTGAGGRKEGEIVDVYDELDSSVTRSDATFRRIFAHAGWRVERTELQRGFAGVMKGLLPTRFYALRPG